MAFNSRDSVFKQLENVYQKSTPREVILKNLKLILFSDMHKGQKDGADDFQQCKPAYHAALEHYYNEGFTLALLGDNEELWECRAKKVLKAHSDTFELEKKFADANRYIRLSGNHDDYWEKPSVVKKLLQRLTKLTSVEEGLRVLLSIDGRRIEFFLVHGHQGTAESDRWRVISKFTLRHIYRHIQRLFKFKSTTPAKDFKLRKDHEKIMHEWVAQKDDVIMITGHTHRPVFMAKTHDDVLHEQIAEQQKRLAKAETDAEKVEIEQNIRELDQRLEEVLSKSGGIGSGLDPSLKPCYFNTGCCTFRDGDITGIELTDKFIRLVRWPDDDGQMRSKTLEEEELQKL